MKLPLMPSFDHYQANLHRFMATGLAPKVKGMPASFDQYRAGLQKITAPPKSRR